MNIARELTAILSCGTVEKQSRLSDVMCVCSVVHRYDEMAEKVSEIPDDIAALVELQRYYEKVSSNAAVSPAV